METKRLSQQDIQTAADLLRAGGLVGIPTETVYGLGANGLDPAAVGPDLSGQGPPPGQPPDPAHPGGGLAGAVLPGHPGGGL